MVTECFPITYRYRISSVFCITSAVARRHELLMGIGISRMFSYKLYTFYQNNERNSIMGPSVYSFINITTPNTTPCCWRVKGIPAHRANEKSLLHCVNLSCIGLNLTPEHFSSNYNFCLADSASRSCAYISASSFVK